MARRYRLHIDLCDNSAVVTVGMIREMLDGMQMAVKLAIPDEHAKDLKVDPRSRGWHSHWKDCPDCLVQAVDAFSDDVSEVFPPKPGTTQVQ